MPGIPVVITDKYGIPVRQVTSGAPLMTVATNGRGIPIVLSNRGMAFVVEGLAPAPSWSVQPSISGATQVGQTLTGADGTIANGTVTLRQWLNAADNSVLGTGSTLLLTEVMEGLNIKFKVTAVGTGGSATATSSQVGPVGASVSRVRLVRNDALARFDISNTASFPGGTWTWYDDAGTQVGTVTTPYLLYSAVPAGKLIKARANGNAATDSILWAVQRTDAIFDIDFSTKADQPLNGMDGITADAAYAVIGGKLTCSAGERGFSRDLGLPDQTVIMRPYQVVGSNPPDSPSMARTIRLGAASNGAYYVEVAFKAGAMSFEKKTPLGSWQNYHSSLSFPSGIENLNNHKVAVQLIWVSSMPYIRVYIDDVRIDGEGGIGISVNATGSPLGQNNYMYFYGPEGTGTANPSFPIATLASIAAQSVPNVGLRVDTVAFNLPTSSVPPSITFTGFANYTAIQAVVVSSDGYELGGITSFTGLTPGSVSLSLPNPPEGMGEFGFLRLRQTSNTTNYIDFPLGKLPYYDAVDTLEAGFNIGGNGSSSFSDTVQDRGWGVSWRYYNPDTSAQDYIPDSDKNAEGWPINVAIPAPYTERLAIFFEGNGPGIRTGPWTITADGWSCTSPMVAENLNGIMTASGATTTSITLTQVDTSGGSQGAVRFPGAVPPAGGLKVKCLKVGETVDGNSVTPGLAAIFGSAAFPDRRSIRIMKTTGADGGIGGTTNPVLVNFAGTAEYAADLTYRLGEGTDIHWNTPWADIILRKSTRITPWMEYFRDNARPTSKLAASPANEVWNSEYKDQFGFMAAAGCNAGLMPEITFPGGVTVTAEYYSAANPTGAVEELGLTRRTINPNETFTARVTDYQWGIYQCISATPVAAGYVIPQLGDSKFARLAPFAGVATASRRMQGECQKQMAIEGRAILGDRFISTYEIFLDDTPEKVRDYLMFNDTWQYVDEISPSFYSGEYTNYGDLPWHDKFTSDFAAFKAGMIAREVATRSVTLAKLVNLKHRVPALLLEAGVPLAQLPRVRRPYEGGTHNGIKGVPDANRAAFIAAGVAVIESAEYAAEMAAIWTGLKDQFGGPCEWFQDIERFWWNFGGGQMQWFGLREYQFDGAWNASGANERRYLATRAVFGT